MIPTMHKRRFQALFVTLGCALGFGCAAGGDGFGNPVESVATNDVGSKADAWEIGSTPIEPDMATTPDQRCGAVNCPASFLCCNAECINPTIDPRHCGTCSTLCTGAESSQVCQAGRCTVARCNAGFSDCDSVAANGCEIETDFDMLHCGACGRVCQGIRCEGGDCIEDTSCPENTADCNRSSQDGCEVDLTEDPEHCGACGRRCPENETCVNGQCRCGTQNGCTPAEYCFDNRQCVPIPTFSQYPACADLGQVHSNTSTTVLSAYVVRGRPGAVVRKWNTHLSCNGVPTLAPESENDAQVLDANGELIFSIQNNRAFACDELQEILGEFEAWVVVDGIESNRVQTTYLNSTPGCTGFETCAEATRYCGLTP